MDLARCTLDGTVYTAIQFSQFTEGKRQELRRCLICDKCKQEAYFRSASRHGNSACFGSRKHLDECGERRSSGTTSQEPRKDVEVVNEIIKDHKTLVLDRSQNEIGDDSTANTSHDNERNSYASPSKSHIRRPAETRRYTCDLVTLLQYLIKSERFAQYDGFIETGSPHPWKVKNLFVQFNDIREFHVGRWRGYWGMITDADSGINCLNSGGRDTVSVFLDPEIRKGILKKYRISDSEDVAGCYALVFGTHV